jgi:hypothetical protein
MVSSERRLEILCVVTSKEDRKDALIIFVIKEDTIVLEIPIFNYNIFCRDTNYCTYMKEDWKEAAKWTRE